MEEALPDESVAQQAAAFEASLMDEGSPGTNSFTAGQMDRASTLMMLNRVFTIGRCKSVMDSNERGLPRTHVGRFRLLKHLGSGGFGDVYSAMDDRLQREVAIKIAKLDQTRQDEARKRILREGVVAARLDHPNIVGVYGSDEDGDLLFLISELCRGPSMADWLKGLGEPVSLRSAIRIVQQLASALRHAHENGVLHRDIKPANVMLDPSTESDDMGFIPRLTDFGLAKDFSGSTEQSKSGAFVGTLMYASPEQLRGESNRLSVASDIYSVGVVLYELLTGSTPHAGAPHARFRALKRGDVVVRPSTLRPCIPAALDRICCRCLSQYPGDRYQSAQDLEADLDAARMRIPTDGSYRITARRARFAAIGATSAAMLGAIAVTVWSTTEHAEVPAQAATSANADSIVSPVGSTDGILRLDGTGKDAYIESFDYDGSHPITAEVWVKPSMQPIAGTPHKATLLNLSGLVGIELHSLVPTATAGPEFEVYLYQYGEAPLRPDRWTHLAVTYDGRGITLYVNGVASNGPTSRVQWDAEADDYTRDEVALPNFELAPIYFGLGTVIGASGLEADGGALFPFQGEFDEVRVSGRAVTQFDLRPDRALTRDENTILLRHF
ncbi:MAG: protein kinase [Planctomycetota bacterium]